MDALTEPTINPGADHHHWVDRLPLVDQHCHGVLGSAPDAAAFGALLTEAGSPAPGADPFDSALGLSVRRWCAPVLDLPAHAPGADYVTRRAELGGTEANRRLLRATGTATLLLDTGLAGTDLLGLAAMGEASGAPAHEIVRLEAVAEEVADTGVGPSGYSDDLSAELARRTASAVAVKSIIAYRLGFDFDPAPPDPAAVRAAAGSWLPAAPGARLTEPVLLRHALWCGVETGLPLQLHTGLGDPDEDLHRANPVLLTAFCRAVAAIGTPLVLLHCYPYHREAAWMAHVFPHVHVDIGLASTFVGARASTVLAELLELAPFGKVLYSSDGYGLAELYHLGALRFRHAVHDVLDGWRRAGEADEADVQRIAAMIAHGNAQRLYRLSD